MDHQLPFPIEVRRWEELKESERRFFCFQDEYSPLHTNHAAQIGLLVPKAAKQVDDWATAAIPVGWPDSVTGSFPFEEQRNIRDGWDNPVERAAVRKWLFDRGVPFCRTVYLLYDRNMVVRTTWRLVVRYWDAFAWSVGIAMYVIDHTLQWTCCFHHEDVIVFGGRSASLGRKW